MDKVKIFGTITVFLVLISCFNLESNKTVYKIKFMYNPWTEIDFTNNRLDIRMGAFNYSDSILFSEIEYEEILSSFYENKIQKLESDVFLSEGKIDMPPVNFIIIIYNSEKKISEITINQNYTINNLWPIGKSYRIKKFEMKILEILNSNKKFKKAMNIFLKYQNDNKYIGL